jgi:ZPR1 zinc finger protein
MGNEREKEPTLEEKYSLPKLQEVPCPRCKTGKIQINRTLHKLPDNEEILILLMECDSCSFSRSDVIPLSTAFQPGTFTLNVKEGDLTAKIFRSPTGVITLPEADFEIEPGKSAEYLITNVEGILNRMIKWSNFMLDQYRKEEAQHKKIQETLNILTKCLDGTMNFTIVLTDTGGGSYISPSNENNLDFIPIPYKD